ncbi:hypothetical protein OKA05_01900 [Luteolibacter arcticus]|uniref:Core-binding (CB) domain-containing protein n=1 Tax=Luteolibacter arcticus TaxID=1581411 RepID=A0ABT3GCC6_9BACT|nr:hypothetical protein [Luteolibacter arcticus]MCW1921285.1 hypothetical protein [Luteolibacter arcticus]
MPVRQSLKVGRITVEIYPWQHPTGRDYWRWDFTDPDTSKRRQLTASTPEKLKEKIAKQLHGGEVVDVLAPVVKARLARILKADPTLRLLEEFMEWKTRQHPDVTLHAVVAEFLAIKEANRGASERNIRSLRGDLGSLKAHFHEAKGIGAVTVKDLEEWLAKSAHLSAKRRRNLRGAAVTLFRWARKRDYLPDKTTAAEKLERPKVVRKVPPTYTVGEMRKLLDACPPEYRSWLVLSGFHGLRYSELFPPYGSEKSPLAGEDINLDRGLIIVRAETAKMDERRVIKLHDNAAAWLSPLPSGRLTPTRPPNKKLKHEDALTTRLGELVGGWKPNGLRNSFISFRAALVGLAQTSMEAGNSEAEARKSYNDAKSREEAEEWFALLNP